MTIAAEQQGNSTEPEKSPEPQNEFPDEVEMTLLEHLEELRVSVVCQFYCCRCVHYWLLRGGQEHRGTLGNACPWGDVFAIGPRRIFFRFDEGGCLLGLIVGYAVSALSDCQIRATRI